MAWKRGSYFRWAGSCFLDWTIGYGLGGRYFIALMWVLAFAVIGTCVLCYSGQSAKIPGTGLPEIFFYSLDQLLPIVDFDKYDGVSLKGGVAYYFHIQTLFGFLLGSFIVAGLAGLTQKQ